jgi:hypothetical protein
MRRCKDHLTDLTSCNGVCASCLNQRLTPLSKAQTADEDLTRRKLHNAAVSHVSDHRFHNTPQVRIRSTDKTNRWALLSNLFRSTFWLSSSAAARRRKLFVDDSNPALDQISRGGRGMSPASEVDAADEPVGEFPEVVKMTPKRASRRVGGRRNLPGMVLCLNPLVRASPNRKWNPPGEIDMRSSPVVKPHLANAASSYANRSRKIADTGRFHHTR